MTYDVRWTETMRGQVVVGADVFKGSRAAKSAVDLQFTLQCTIGSLERFKQDDEHRVEAEGHVSSDLIGGRRPVDRGKVCLFRPTTSEAVTAITYHLEFRDPFGTKFKLVCVKTVRDDRGPDLWPDTSRCEVTLSNLSAPRARDRVVARGEVRISLSGFLALLLTMRAAGDDTARWSPRRMLRHISLRIRFIVWFSGQLAKIYGNPFTLNRTAGQVTGARVGRHVEDGKFALRFCPRPPVDWSNPLVLYRTYRLVDRSTSLGRSVDTRELQRREATVITELAVDSTGKDKTEAWIDFVADTGDGFAATYSVAYTVSKPELSVGDEETRRGTALILGGDLNYPTPSRDEYENRLCGPFRAAMPEDPAEGHVVLAIPGNHDWYDNIQSFSHFFMAGRRWLGGRRTIQSRSYFAARLPHGWWVLGMDVALDEYVDDQQKEFFEEVLSKVGEQDSTILVVAKPAWLNDPSSRAAKNLQFVEEQLVRNGTLRLVLSGDQHHYARYGSAVCGPTRITCGGGGAYTAGTHHLPEALDPSWNASDDVKAIPLFYRYPDRSQSRRMRRGVLLSLLGRLPFLFGVGVMALLLVLALLSDDLFESPSTVDRLRAASLGQVPWAAVRGLISNPIAIISWSVLFVGAIVLALSGRHRAGWAVSVGAGIVHAGVQLAALVVIVWLLLHVESNWLRVFAVGTGTVVLGGGVAALIAGVYLVATDRWKLHPDLVFAAQGRTQCKSFLRLHVDGAGGLDVYALGIPQVVSMWEPNKGAPAQEPLLVPTGVTDAEAMPRVELIEQLHLPASGARED